MGALVHEGATTLEFFSFLSFFSCLGWKKTRTDAFLPQQAKCQAMQSAGECKN